MSNHITEQDAREAAANLCDDSYGPTDDDFIKWHKDIQTCAKWIVEELSRRDAERAEREKPIDAEWLNSISTQCPFNELYRVLYVATYGDGWETAVRCAVTEDGKCLLTIIQDGEMEQPDDIVFLGQVKTRGQLLDLLAALKGGTE